MNGWIKIHRQIEEWEWYTDANTFRLFFHLLIKANHKDKRWRGLQLKKGSVVTGLSVLSAETKMSIQSVRTSLKKLESTNEITSKTSNKGTIIQVVRYDEYQQNDNDQQTNNKPANKRTTNEQQTNNKPLTTIEERKKDKNDKNDKKKRKEVVLPFGSDEFKKWWELWKEYKLEQHKFKYNSAITEQAALTRLSNDSGCNEIVAIDMIQHSISRGWKGIIKEEKRNGKQTSKEKFYEPYADLAAKYAKGAVEFANQREEDI